MRSRALDERFAGLTSNRTARTTHAVSASQLRAEIRAADITQAGTATVTVRQQVGQQNRGSNSVSFTITAATSPPPAAGNPVPVTASLSPASMTVGGAEQNLTVDGSGFVAATTVRWNGPDRTTTLVSPTGLPACC